AAGAGDAGAADGRVSGQGRQDPGGGQQRAGRPAEEAGGQVRQPTYLTRRLPYSRSQPGISLRQRTSPWAGSAPDHSSPSRLNHRVCSPTARAPATSSTGWSPTCRAACGSTPARSRAARKGAGSGLLRPTSSADTITLKYFSSPSLRTSALPLEMVAS